jgi:hypothetical protein
VSGGVCRKPSVCLIALSRNLISLILADPEGHIIAGHGRLQAARLMGLAELPVITLSGLSEAQKRTLRITDNKIALNAGWDLEILQLELGELGSIDVDIDLTLTGFSTGECGDGRDAEFLQRVIGHGARVDAAFLDPPYNVRIGGHAVSAGSHREFAMASGEMSEAEFRSFLTDTLGAAVGVSRDGAVHFVCMDWRHMDDVSAVGRTVYGERLNLCIWNKSNAGIHFLGSGTTLLAADRTGRRHASN